MAIGSALAWFGQQVTNAVLGDVDAKLDRTGQEIVAIAQSLVAVDTGALRQSITYSVQNHTLTIDIGENYGLFIEMGTRWMRARPYIQPALLAVNRVWGGTIDLEFNVPHIAAPVLAHKGIMIVPGGIQPRPLTQAQHRQVQANAATAKGFYRGNVKRANVRVRRKF
jgi:hypothetical protein